MKTDFYSFVKTFNSSICDLYEEINTRKDPKPGDKYALSIKSELHKGLIFSFVTYEGVELDDSFDNGIAFFYIFKNDKDEIVKVRSINKVDDILKLSKRDKKDLFSFWIKCHPLNQ